MSDTSSIIVITGPTASGKSKLSIELAKKINGEIICADSRSVYKDLDIVSAKPTIAEQEGIPHYLIDVLAPIEKFSAGDFVSLAREKIAEIQKRGKRVIVCGGTWFYIKALLDTKSLPLIGADMKLREELNLKTNEELWNMLYKLDSKRASEINKNNKDKVVRAIEMCKSLNAPISEFVREDNDIQKSLWFMPKIDREVLYSKINRRVDLMLDMGLEKELEDNIKKYGADNEVILNTIGYSEFFEYKDRNEAIEKIKQHTRNFAKRQMTYFRSNNDIIQIESLYDILKFL